MTISLIYLVKVNSIILLLFLFYRLVLYYGKLYLVNRFFLLLIPLWALAMPEVNLGIWKVPIPESAAAVEEFTEFQKGVGPSVQTAAGSQGPGLMFWIGLVYFAGLGMLVLFCARDIYALIRLKRRSACISEGKYLYIQTDGSQAFSFFRWIFLPAGRQGREELLLKHEHVHVRQAHSLDILIMEIFRLIFWYNPAVYLIRKQLRETHEYIADQQIVRDGQAVPDYLRVLISEAEFRLIPSFATPFRSSNLKKRIQRLLSERSSRHPWVRYAFLPVLLPLLFISFSGKNDTGSLPCLKPVKYTGITLEFGFTGTHPVTKKTFTHKGVDLRAPLGTDVIATGDGVVIEAVEKEGWGKLIIIRHDESTESYYAHLDDFTVNSGDPVRAGQVIGHVGNTGYSTGPHLHYEVRIKSEPVDPSGYFQ
ncbi:MAG: peptidoglycan DD-metalloendopeptidase family protein [Bacteroidales bacterium]|nr:peptidoglycan DD-metalloendopeptidase family protein [Bacteroidales bacterium]